MRYLNMKIWREEVTGGISNQEAPFDGHGMTAAGRITQGMSAGADINKDKKTLENNSVIAVSILKIFRLRLIDNFHKLVFMPLNLNLK